MMWITRELEPFWDRIRPNRRVRWGAVWFSNTSILGDIRLWVGPRIEHLLSSWTSPENNLESTTVAYNAPRLSPRPDLDFFAKDRFRVQGEIDLLRRSLPPEGPSRGQSRPELGAIGPFLEPFVNFWKIYALVYFKNNF